MAAPPDGLRFVRVSLSCAVGVGSEQKESFAKVRGTDACRGYTVPFRIPPARGQVGKDVAEPSANEPWDIFHEEESRSHVASDPPDLGPEPAFISLCESLTSDANGLTWEPSSDEIHDATPRRRIEGAQVTPDRSRIQGRVRHPGHEDGRAVGLPLDSAHKTMVGSGDSDANVEASDAGAESKGT